MKAWFAIPISCLVLCVPARAEDLNGVWFAGGSAGDSVSAYAGTVVALPGYRLGRGWAIKAVGNGGRYRYETGGTIVRATYYGGSVAAVRQFSGPWGWANVSVGPRVTNTDLSPPDPANRRAGTRWDIDLATDGALDRARWRLGWFAELGVRDERYIAQAQAGYRIDGRGTRLGVRAAVQGDERYSQRSAGLLLGLSPGQDLALEMSAGIADQADRSPQPYASVGLSRVF